MATPYDVITGNFDLGDQDAMLDEYLSQNSAIDVGSDLQNRDVVGVDATTPMEQYAARQQGLVPREDGRFYDPNLNIARSREARYKMMLDQDFKKRQEIADSTLFKIGDTLADTGRMFLSPLFWLKGEDTTQYDPSERLKTGYKIQFEQLQILRETNVEKFLNSRNTRLANAQTLNLQRSQLNLQAQSPRQRELVNFANRRDLGAWLQDPSKQDLLERMHLLSMDQAVELGDSTGKKFILRNGEMAEVNRYGKSFIDETQNLRDTFSNVNQLLRTPNDGTGISDVAAIFAFIKGIDPTSVVRESEVQLFRQTIGLIESIELAAAQAGEGRLLRPNQIKELKRYARVLGAAMSRKFNDRKNIAKAQMGNIGLTSDELQETYLGGYTAPVYEQMGGGGGAGEEQIDMTPEERALFGMPQGNPNEPTYIFPN